MRFTWVLTLATFSLAGPTPAPAAEDCYFVTVFGGQRPLIKLPRYSHSFALFAHLCPDGRMEAFTLSWLPASGEIRIFALGPEPGRNYDLYQTLQFCRTNRMEVAYWGPYRCHPDLWRRALWQKTRLDNGRVLYKAFDDGSPCGDVSDCVHSIEFITRPPGQERPQVVVLPANWGESGSYWVALTMRPWYLQPCQTEDWLLTRFGLDPRAFTHYGLDRNPTLNPLTAAVQSAIHTDLLPNRVNCCSP